MRESQDFLRKNLNLEKARVMDRRAGGCLTEVAARGSSPKKLHAARRGTYVSSLAG